MVCADPRKSGLRTLGTSLFDQRKAYCKGEVSDKKEYCYCKETLKALVDCRDCYECAKVFGSAEAAQESCSASCSHCLVFACQQDLDCPGDACYGKTDNDLLECAANAGLGIGQGRRRLADKTVLQAISLN